MRTEVAYFSSFLSLALEQLTTSAAPTTHCSMLRMVIVILLPLRRDSTRQCCACARCVALTGGRVDEPLCLDALPELRRRRMWRDQDVARQLIEHFEPALEVCDGIRI